MAESVVMTEGDEETEPRTSREIRAAVQELLKYGLLENDRKPNLYKLVFRNQKEVNRILEPLDLALKLDEIRELLFVVLRHQEAMEPHANDSALAGDMDTEADRTHPLIRRQRLTVEQSLLVAVLRKRYMEHEQDNSGEGDARVAVDELVSELATWLPESGSETRDEKRLRTLLEQLRAHALVSEVDEHDRVTIRPLICHVADPDSLKALIEHFRNLPDKP